MTMQYDHTLQKPLRHTAYITALSLVLCLSGALSAAAQTMTSRGINRAPQGTTLIYIIKKLKADIDSTLTPALQNVLNCEKQGFLYDKGTNQCSFITPPEAQKSGPRNELLRFAHAPNGQFQNDWVNLTGPFGDNTSGTNTSTSSCTSGTETRTRACTGADVNMPAANQNQITGNVTESRQRSCTPPSATPTYSPWVATASSCQLNFGGFPLNFGPMDMNVSLGTFGVGGLGGGMGGGKVICTELYRQGLLPEGIYRSDQLYGRTIVSPAALKVYHLWGEPTARLMQKSPLVTAIVRPLATAWAEHMAYEMGLTESDNMLGRILRMTFLPLHEALGSILYPALNEAVRK